MISKKITEEDIKLFERKGTSTGRIANTIMLIVLFIMLVCAWWEAM